MDTNPKRERGAAACTPFAKPQGVPPNNLPFEAEKLVLVASSLDADAQSGSGRLAVACGKNVWTQDQISIHNRRFSPFDRDGIVTRRRSILRMVGAQDKPTILIRCGRRTNDAVWALRRRVQGDEGARDRLPFVEDLASDFEDRRLFLAAGKSKQDAATKHRPSDDTTHPTWQGTMHGTLLPQNCVDETLRAPSSSPAKSALHLARYNGERNCD